MSVENSSEISKVIEVLVTAGSCEWLTAKLLRSRIEVGSQEYQGMALQNTDAILEQCKVHVLADLQKLDYRIQERLE